MILVDYEIEDAIKSKELIIDPYYKNNIGPTSYDVTLSSNFTLYPIQIFDISDDIESESIIIKENESIILSPPHFDVFYENDYIVFRSKYQSDLVINPNDINLALNENDFAIFTAVLGSTNEYIKLPDNISAEYTGRSSLGRLFLQSHQTAGWIDAGFEGTITLEMVALDCPIILYPNVKIGQLIFYKHNSCKTPYFKRNTSKYNGQVGAVPSRINFDFM